MITLSAFADEISADLAVQVRTLQAEGIRFVELRGVWDVNVLDFSPAQRRDIRARLSDAGIGVSAIGSPIGKVRLDEPWPEHLDRFRAALDAAEFFRSPYIRLFSYYPPEGGRIADHRDEVVRRLREQVRLAEGRPVRLLHENEKKIYGEGIEGCLDLARSVPGLGLIFDPANFVQAGVRPAEAWPVLRGHVVYFHVKDALLGSGRVVPAGEGDGAVRDILRDALLGRRYDGFLSLEPHLKVAGEMKGFSGPDLFQKASRALKAVLADLGVAYS
jgi:sugar phosphate isomerase/epimerase